MNYFIKRYCIRHNIIKKTLYFKLKRSLKMLTYCLKKYFVEINLINTKIYKSSYIRQFHQSIPKSINFYVLDNRLKVPL